MFEVHFISQTPAPHSKTAMAHAWSLLHSRSQSSLGGHSIVAPWHDEVFAQSTEHRSPGGHSIAMPWHWATSPQSMTHVWSTHPPVQAAGQSSAVGSGDASQTKGPPVESADPVPTESVPVEPAPDEELELASPPELDEDDAVVLVPDAGPSKSSFGTRQPATSPRVATPHPRRLVHPAATQ